MSDKSDSADQIRDGMLNEEWKETPLSALLPNSPGGFVGRATSADKSDDEPESMFPPEGIAPRRWTLEFLGGEGYRVADGSSLALGERVEVVEAAPIQLEAARDVLAQADSPITVREAARCLGVHENTIRNWQKKGIIGRSIVLPSGIRRFSAEDIKRMRDEMWTQFAPATELPDQRGSVGDD